MPRKVKGRPAADDAEGRFARRMAYQLGGLLAYFRTSAEASWRTACEGDGPPPCLRGWAAQLRDVVERLTPAGADRVAVARADLVRGRAEELLSAYEGMWDGPEHRELMACRDGSDPDLVSPEGDPEIDATWSRLRTAVDAFIDALPPAERSWAGLGGLVAELLNSPLGGPEAVAILPVLGNQLAELADDALLAGVDLDLSTGAFLRGGVGPRVSQDRWVRERVLAAHDAIGTRASSADTPGRPEGPGAPGGSPPRKASLALALLAEHPDWTDARIAEVAGCARSTLHRNSLYQRARAVLRQEKSLRPRGTRASGKDGTTRLEAEGLDRMHERDD